MRIDPCLGDKIRAVSLLCSLLICLTHTYTVPGGMAPTLAEPMGFSLVFIENTVKFGLAKVSTPFFFAIAGFLLFRALYPVGHWCGSLFPSETHRTEVRKRVRSLLIPFVLMSVCSFAFILALQSVPGLPLRAADPLAQRTWAELAETLLWNPVAYPLWFVRNLFLLCLAAPLFALALRQRVRGAVVLAAAATAWCLWPEIRATRSILFFAIGAYLAMHHVAARRVSAGGCVALGVAWLVASAAHGHYTLRVGATHALLNNAAVVTGLLAVWFGFDHLERWTRTAMVQRAAAFTFFIYITHEPLATVMRKGAIAVIGGGNHGMLLVAWPMLALILWLGCLVAGVTLSRHLPHAYAFLTGGRRPSGRGSDISAVLAKAS